MSDGEKNQIICEALVGCPETAEICAELAENMGRTSEGDEYDDGWDSACWAIATAIRALKGGGHE